MGQVSSNNEVLFVAKKSAWAHRTKMIFSIIFAVLGAIFAISFFMTPDGGVLGAICIAVSVICVLSIIFTIIEASKSEIRIYDKFIITKKGIFNVKETRSVMTPIVGVSVEQSLGGKIFNYGNIKIDKMGRGWDVDCTYIKNPEAFKRFLQERMEEQNTDNVTMIMGN